MIYLTLFEIRGHFRNRIFIIHEKLKTSKPKNFKNLKNFRKMFHKKLKLSNFDILHVTI